MEIFVQILVAVLFIGAGVALIFWDKILKWADNAFFPWIRENFSSELEYKVRYAFAALDKFATPIHRNMKALTKLTDIKKAWEMLRKYLLKVLVQFEQNARNEWVKRITYWVIRYLKSKQETPALQVDVVDFDSLHRTPESNKQEVVRVVAEEIIGVDSLPPDVRQEWLKRGNTTQDVDVTQVRDRELQLAMTNSN